MDVLIDGLHKSLGEYVVVSNEINTDSGDKDTRELQNFGNFLVLQPLSDGLKMAFGANINSGRSGL